MISESIEMIIDLPKVDGIEIGFQSSFDFLSYKYIFKYDYCDSDPSKKITLASNDKELIIKYIRTHPKQHFYEVIPYDVPVREYVDIDYYHECEADEQDTITDEIVDQYLTIRNKIITECLLSKKDLIVCTSHTKDKISLHIYSTRTGFSTNQIQKLYQSDVSDAIAESDVAWNIDKTVYSRNRAFRCLFQTKRGKKSYLKVHHPNVYQYATFEDTLVRLDADVTDTLAFRLLSEKYNSDDVVVHAVANLDTSAISHTDQDISKFLQEHIEFKIKHRTDKLIKLERVSPSKCLSGDRIHQTQDAFIYSCKDKIYFCCYCTERKPIQIGTNDMYYTDLFDVQPDETKYEYIETTRISHDEYATLLDDVYQLFDTRHMGNGKTFNAMHYGKLRGKVLCISHRITLDGFISEEYDIASYRKVQAVDVDSISCVLNSLSKTLEGTTFQSFDTIIIDEVRSVLKQTEMKNIKEDVFILIDILKNYTGKLILMDANLTDTDIEFLLELRRNSDVIELRECKYKILKSPTIQHKLMSVAVTIPSNVQYSAFFTEIVNNDFRRYKIIIPHNFDINKKCQTFLSMIRYFCSTKNLKIIEINKDTRQQIDLSADNLLSYDIIVQSPTLEAGYSFDDPRFGMCKIYAYFTNLSSDAESGCQMIGRWRAVTDINVCLGYQPYTAKFQSKEEYLAYADSHRKDVCDTISTRRVFNPNKKITESFIIQDEFWDLHVKNVIEAQRIKDEFVETFIQKSVNNGFRVNNKGEDIHTFFDKEMWSIESNKSIKTYYTEVKDAPLIDQQTYDMLKKRDPTHEISLQLTKFNIHKAMNFPHPHPHPHPHLDEMSYEVYKYYDREDVKRQVYNLRKLFVFERDVSGSYYQVHTQKIIDELVDSSYNDITDKHWVTFLDQKDKVLQMKASPLKNIYDLLKRLGFMSIPYFNEMSVAELDDRIEALRTEVKHSHYNNLCRILWIQCNAQRYKKAILNSSEMLKFINNIILKPHLGCTIKKDKGKAQLLCTIKYMTLANINVPHMVDFPRTADRVLIEKYDRFFASDPTTYHCGICNKDVVGTAKYEAHNKSKAHLRNVGIVEECGDEFRCNRCSKIFSRKQTLDTHMIKCGQPKPKKTYSCDLCVLVFRDKTDYNRHMRSTAHAVRMYAPIDG